MVNRLVFIKFLVPAMCLLASTALTAQNVERHASEAEKAAWIKSHPEEYSRMGGKVASETKEVAKVSEAAPVVQAPVKGNANYAATIPDEALPAVYKQSGDYKDPMVRERIEQDIKAGKVPASVASKQSTPKVSTVAPTTAPVAVSAREGLPQDWPVYYNTGNKAADDANYSAAKVAYLKSLPAQVQPSEVSNPKVVAPVTKYQIPRSEFDAQAQERKDEMLAHPEKYEIIEGSHN